MRKQGKPAMTANILIVIHFKNGNSTTTRINKEKGMLHFNAEPTLLMGNPIVGLSVFADGENWSM